MRKQIITPEMIIEATINCVEQYDLQNLTTKKVATSISISEGTIFHKFPTKQILLTKSFYYIGKKIDSILQDIPSEDLDVRKNIHMLWHQYFDYLVTHKSYTKYYRQFRQSSYFTPRIDKGQNKSFRFFTQFLIQNRDLVNRLSHCQPTIYWTFLIETTLSSALRMANGEVADTPENREMIFNLIAHGFLGNI